MFALLLCAVLTTTDIDKYCRETFGHPGNLGVTSEAAKHFSEKTSWAEATVTIGELGKELPSSSGTRTCSWQGGKLEMQFRGDRLTQYRLNGNSKVFAIPVGDVLKPFSDRTQPQGAQSTGIVGQPTRVPDRQQEYQDFQQRVEQIVRTGNQVTENSQERSDIEVLRFHLTKLNRAIDAKDWKRAAEIRDSMRVSLQRSQAVAIDAERRLAQRKRADEERRHSEEMRQRERHHKELRKQEALLNELRWLRGY